ncbi:SCO family protein [Halioxenophilus aromaticivorans]|uniref:Cytochrome c oxidase copper chaperone SenC n=1 Tax=Halioxenophilus aromaticivorans TaxID=1306992 RepID=A0AAV3U873_9ALTE
MDTVAVPQKNTRGIWFTVCGALLFIALVLLLFANKFFAPSRATPQQLTSDTLKVLQIPRPLALGELIDQNGEAISAAYFTGRWNLIFFGFTHCPDICPTTLFELNKAIKQLPPMQADKIQVTLISVDPARDTSEQLQQYVHGFNAKFDGITGEFLSLKKLANSVSVPFFKVPVDHNHGKHAEHMGMANYQVDHGSQVVVINPNGEYHAFFNAPVKGIEVARQIPGLMAAF